MKVFLRDIPYEGLTVQENVTAEELGLGQETFSCSGPLAISVVFEKAEDVLLAQVTVTGSYELNCSRCLGTIRQDARLDKFQLTFDLTPKTEFIEYGEEIRQELLISLSRIIRCREDCRGICPGCGVNLNTQSCQCNKSSGKINIQFDKSD